MVVTCVILRSRRQSVAMQPPRHHCHLHVTQASTTRPTFRYHKQTAFHCQQVIRFRKIPKVSSILDQCSSTGTKIVQLKDVNVFATLHPLGLTNNSLASAWSVTQLSAARRAQDPTLPPVRGSPSYLIGPAPEILRLVLSGSRIR